MYTTNHSKEKCPKKYIIYGSFELICTVQLYTIFIEERIYLKSNLYSTMLLSHKIGAILENYMIYEEDYV